MKNKFTLILSSITAFAMLVGCSKDDQAGGGKQGAKQEKIDPVALDKLDEAVRAYRKFITSMESGGLTKDEIRNTTNNADFMLKDVATYFTAKKINTKSLGFDDINEFYKTLYELVTWYTSPKLADSDYNVLHLRYVYPGSEAQGARALDDDRRSNLNYLELRYLLTQYPQLKKNLTAYMGRINSVQTNIPIPVDVVDEILIDYKITNNEPKNFFETFEKKYNHDKYMSGKWSDDGANHLYGFGFLRNTGGYHNLEIYFKDYEQFRSAVFTDLKERVEALNMKIKEQM